MARGVADGAVGEDEDHEVEDDAEAPEGNLFAGAGRQDEQDRGEEDETCGGEGEQVELRRGRKEGGKWSGKSKRSEESG